MELQTPRLIFAGDSLWQQGYGQGSGINRFGYIFILKGLVFSRYVW